MKRNTCSNCDMSDDGECNYGVRHPKDWCSDWTPIRRDPGGKLLGMVGVVLMVLAALLMAVAVSCNR